MRQFPTTMRTGRGLPVCEEQDGMDAWIKFVESTFLAFVQRGFEVACDYAREGGRGNCVTAEDCVYGLKYTARTFLHEDEFESRVVRVHQTLQEYTPCEDSNLDTGSETEEEEENVSESDPEEGEILDEYRRVPSSPHPAPIPDAVLDDVLYRDFPDFFVDESLYPLFQRAPETSPFVRAVHEIVDTWEEWSPTDPVEKLLKQSIRTADQAVDREDRPDVRFRKRRSQTRNSACKED